MKNQFTLPLLIGSLFIWSCNLDRVDPIQPVDPPTGVSFDVSFGPNCPCVPCEVSFTNTSMGGNSYHWDFGDDATSTEENPSHVYNQKGDFEVVLTVSNGIESADTSAIIEMGGGSTFALTVGTINSETAADVVLLDDGSYVVVGSQYNNDDNQDYVYFVKIDADGNLDLQRVVTTSFSDADVHSAIATTKNRIALVGSADDAAGFGTGQDVILLQITQEGDLIDEDAYDSGNTIYGDFGYDLKETSDRGFILGCEYDDDAVLIKTDENGQLEWDEDVNGSDDYGSINRVVITSGQRYYVSGSTKDASNIDFVFAAKTTTSGYATWFQEVEETETSSGGYLAESPDGSYFVSWTRSFPGDTTATIAIARYQADQTQAWINTYESTSQPNYDLVFDCVATPDGGLVVTGATFTDISIFDADLFLLKVDAQGNELWRRQYGNSGTYAVEVGSSVELAHDCGLIVVGFTNSEGAGESDFYILRTDAEGNL